MAQQQAQDLSRLALANACRVKGNGHVTHVHQAALVRGEEVGVVPTLPVPGNGQVYGAKASVQPAAVKPVFPAGRLAGPGGEGIG